MSKIDSGRIEVETPQKTYTLQPTLKALRSISRQFGGCQAAIERIRALDFDAIRFVIVQGASLDGKDAKRVDDHLFEAGLLELAAPTIEYVAILQNGGRPLSEIGAEDDDEGNGSAA